MYNHLVHLPDIVAAHLLLVPTHPSLAQHRLTLLSNQNSENPGLKSENSMKSKISNTSTSAAASPHFGIKIPINLTFSILSLNFTLLNLILS